MSPIFAFFIMMLRRESRDRGALFARLTVGFVLFLGVWLAELEATSRGAPGKVFFQWVIATNYLIVTIAALGMGSQAIAVIACIGERALAENVFIDLLNSVRRHVNVRANDFYGVTRSVEITLLTLAAAIIFKLGQRHLLRRAAEL